MNDLILRLRNLYVQHGTNYVQQAADALEKQQAKIERLENINRDALGNLNDLFDRKNAELTTLKAQAEKDAADAVRYRAALRLYIKAGYGQSTDLSTQGEAYDAAIEAMKESQA